VTAADSTTTPDGRHSNCGEFYTSYNPEVVDRKPNFAGVAVHGAMLLPQTQSAERTMCTAAGQEFGSGGMFATMCSQIYPQQSPGYAQTVRLLNKAGEALVPVQDNSRAGGSRPDVSPLGASQGVFAMTSGVELTQLTNLDTCRSIAGTRAYGRNNGSSSGLAGELLPVTSSQSELGYRPNGSDLQAGNARGFLPTYDQLGYYGQLVNTAQRSDVVASEKPVCGIKMEKQSNELHTAVPNVSRPSASLPPTNDSNNFASWSNLKSCTMDNNFGPIQTLTSLSCLNTVAFPSYSYNGNAMTHTTNCLPANGPNFDNKCIVSTSAGVHSSAAQSVLVSFQQSFTPSGESKPAITSFDSEKANVLGGSESFFDWFLMNPDVAQMSYDLLTSGGGVPLSCAGR
jgi:hypothetical protein